MEYKILINSKGVPVLVEVPDKPQLCINCSKMRREDFKESHHGTCYQNLITYEQALSAALADESKHIVFKDELSVREFILTQGALGNLTLGNLYDIGDPLPIGQSFDLPENISVSFESCKMCEGTGQYEKPYQQFIKCNYCSNGKLAILTTPKQEEPISKEIEERLADGSQDELREKWTEYQNAKYEECREKNISYGDNLDDYIFEFFYCEILSLQNANTILKGALQYHREKPELVPSCGEQEKEKAHYWYYLGAAEGLTHSLAGKKPEFEKAWSRFNENQFQEWTGERTPDNVIDFLMGSGSLCGVWYGDPKPDHEKGNYWWRKHLRKYLESERLKARNEAIQECLKVTDAARGTWINVYEALEKLKSKTI